MDRLRSTAVFAEVVDSGGFAAAGRALQMSPPAVTRAVSHLERAIGTRLLTRTTRTVVLTESGRRYLEDCRRILADVAAAEAAAAGSFAEPNGTLHVTAPVAFGQRHVLPILGDFLREHPQVVGRVLFLDRVAHLIDEGIDVAVRIGRLPDSSLHAIRVGSVRRLIVAAPAYLEKHGAPVEPRDLREHTVVAVGVGPTPQVRWTFGGTTVSLEPRLLCNTIQGGLQAAEAAWGITRLLSYQVQDALNAGRLRRVLTEAEPQPIPVHLVHPEGRHTSAKVRAFLDFAASRLRERLRVLADELEP